jgi:hypothetical protein
MKKGYQLIEPELLAGLVAAPKTFDLSIALLAWVVEVVRAELGDRLKGVELEIIRVEYFGAYPAIGIHYSAADIDDVGPLVEATIVDLVTQRPVADFVSFLMRTPRNWREEAEALLGPES